MFIFHYVSCISVQERCGEPQSQFEIQDCVDQILYKASLISIKRTKFLRYLVF